MSKGILEAPPLFTSDTHYFHKNILKYQPNRGFGNVDEMNKHIVEKYNSVVRPEDICYHLGDIGWFKDHSHALEIFKSLNGTKFIIKGNHDHSDLLKAISPVVSKIDKVMDIRVADKDAARGVQDIILGHFPMLVWNKCYHGAWHLHGHCHGHLREPFQTKRMDVGIDCHPDLAPFTYAEIKEFMSKRKYIAVDHHEEGEV